MEKEQLIKLQQAEIDILGDLHHYCEENHVMYSLFYGTAIGAVRHKGFIPWDDDIDIVMTRENYKKFCTIWKKKPMKGYFLQNMESDPNAGINHAKVRKDNTVLLSEGEILEKGHHGIWIDIFILDKVPNTKKAQRSVRWNTYLRIAFTRADALSTVETGRSKVIKQLLGLIPRKIRVWGLRHAEKKIQQYGAVKDNFSWMSLSCAEELKYHFSKNLVDEYVNVDFDGHQFSMFNNCEETLKMVYGDYMKLPPEEERVCKHAPVKIIL